MYNTGDLVRVNEVGELIYEGRSDGMVKLRGFRVQLDEIENTVLSSQSTLKDCKVIIDQDTLIAFVLVSNNEDHD